MSSFTIIGNGAMGTAIAGVLSSSGAPVQTITRDKLATASIDGDIVVLAVPYPALSEIAAAVGDKLDGKVVVDITNPLDFETFDGLLVPAGSSAAAELQAALPSAKVLKAFNTTFAATLTSKKLGEAQTTVLVAGDDPEAKAALIAGVEAGGLIGIDAGSLARAHELEAFGFLQLTLAAAGQLPWTGGFAVIR